MYFKTRKASTDANHKSQITNPKWFNLWKLEIGNWKFLRSRSGFTLLEIIVVFSVIAIVSTVGIAAFVNYSKTQSLQTSYLDLKSTLSTAKSYTFSQIKPAECNAFELLGYEVSIDVLNNQYSLIAKCEGFSKTLKTSSFPKDISFVRSITTTPDPSFCINSDRCVFFKVITNSSPTCTPLCSITVEGYENQRTISVDNLGGIR